MNETSVEENEAKLFSLSIVIPFIFASMALYKFNKYPSQTFVGDTYTYFAGMIIAVAGITGHLTKYILLFMIPQILNFVLSLPQLFNIVPCPRHRLPKLNETTMKMECVHNHYNLINAFLRIFGPTNEKQAVNALVLFQVFCCLSAIFIKFYLSDMNI